MAEDETSPTLLFRVRNAQDDAAWREFAALYTPVIRSYARRCGVPGQELDDLVQEVLWAVSKVIGGFNYDPARGRFRSWLWSVTHRRILKWRSGMRRAEIQPEDSEILHSAAATDAELEEYWEKQWARRILARATERAREHFGERTFEAFERYVLRQQPAAEVAERLGMEVTNVYLCKSRLLAQIRREVENLDG